ncbi:heterokaryon incompatibility protein-domain-containing protein [Rostrohypoxylon terebratum]|nr:heterokaryon incompatibility protein-domain-containing protein [Rostrohypoxylon terebratum]
MVKVHRLINVETYKLEKPLYDVPYAALSHRWGYNQEVSYKDMNRKNGVISRKTRNKTGFRKIQGACEQAKTQGLKYVWIDTCCINKENSTELIEALNSMYRYYNEATICYAYLAGLDHYCDPRTSAEFADHEWFTRGWTLQELVAPREVEFYTDFWSIDERDPERNIAQAGWVFLGRKSQLGPTLSRITGMDEYILLDPKKVHQASIAKRMSWAAGRSTSQPEDRAYSLMGIFGIHMPVIYGEGKQAFERLQGLIMMYSSDESIFAWRSDQSDKAQHRELVGLLAESPDMFKDSGHFTSIDWIPRSPFSKTSRGVEMTLPLHRIGTNLYVIALNCALGQYSVTAIGIYLVKTTNHHYNEEYLTHDQFARVYSDELIVFGSWINIERPISTIFIQATEITSSFRKLPTRRLIQVGSNPPSYAYNRHGIEAIKVEKVIGGEMKIMFHLTMDADQYSISTAFQEQGKIYLDLLNGSNNLPRRNVLFIMKYTGQSSSHLNEPDISPRRMDLWQDIEKRKLGNENVGQLRTLLDVWVLDESDLLSLRPLLHNDGHYPNEQPPPRFRNQRPYYNRQPPLQNHNQRYYPNEHRLLYQDQSRREFTDNVNAVELEQRSWRIVDTGRGLTQRTIIDYRILKVDFVSRSSGPEPRPSTWTVRYVGSRVT